MYIYLKTRLEKKMANFFGMVAVFSLLKKIKDNYSSEHQSIIYGRFKYRRVYCTLSVRFFKYNIAKSCFASNFCMVSVSVFLPHVLCAICVGFLNTFFG